MIDWVNLKKLSKFETFEDMEKFERQVWDIVELKNINDLRSLLDLFDDNTEHPEVMYTLVHAVERYPDNDFMIIFFEKLSDMLINSPGFLKTLTFRIINHPVYIRLFQSYFSKEKAGDLLKLFDLMEKYSEKHKRVLDELRAELATKH